MGLIFDEPRAEERKDHKQQREERLDRMLAEARKTWTQGHPAARRGNKRRVQR